MDRAVGPLTLHSSLSHLVRYIRYGIRLLKESHWLLVWTLSTDCIFLLINKLPESETISHVGHRAGWRWLLVNISFLCLSYESRDRIYFPLWQSETLVIYIFFWKKERLLTFLYVFRFLFWRDQQRQKNALLTFSIALPPTYPGSLSLSLSFALTTRYEMWSSVEARYVNRNGNFLNKCSGNRGASADKSGKWSIECISFEGSLWMRLKRGATYCTSL
jgi:hypothetical protein